MKHLQIFIFIFITFITPVSVQAQDSMQQLKDKIVILNESIEVLSDTVVKGISVRFDARRNVILFTMRVIKTPDPFTESLGRFYKEYYKKVQIYQLIEKWLNKDGAVLDAIIDKEPEFSFQIYGRTTTSFDISTTELIQAKNRIDKGYVYLETYKDFLSDIYYSSMPKEEFVTTLWEQLSSIAEKVPFQSAECMVMTKLTMSKDNVITFEYLQDDKKGNEDELLYERMSQFFVLKDISRSIIKAFALNNVSVRYIYVNKSNGSIFSDATFSGDDLLQLFDCLNKK